MPPTELPPVVEPEEQVPEATDTSYNARMQWPYLTRDYVGNRATNGRELGCWLTGHLFGRQMHGEPGLRCEVPEAFAAGVAAVFLEHGLTVQRYSFSETTQTLDVWA